MFLFSAEGQQRARWSRPTWVVAWACLAVLVGQATAQQFLVRNYPIPVGIDDEQMLSGVLLQFEMKNYGVAFSKFSAAPQDQREAVFAELVRGIQRNDLKAVEKVFMPARPRQTLPGEKDGLISSPPMTPAQAAADVTAVYRAAFGNFENIDVIAQILVGSKSLFVWDAKIPGRLRRRAFSVEPEGSSRLVAREVIGSAVDSLILSILEEGVKNPAAYAAVPDPHMRYRQPLAIEGKGKTAHEVALLFNGEPMDFDAFGETSASNAVSNPLLIFYRTAYATFKAHKQDSFLAMHDPKSQERLREWWKTFDKNAEGAYYGMVTKGRFVKFVLDAEPVYILFYSQSKGNDWISGSLNYQYVVRNPSTQKYLISNVLSQSFFDDVITRDKLFDQRVLKSPVVASPKLPAVPKKAASAK